METKVVNKFEEEYFCLLEIFPAMMRVGKKGALPLFGPLVPTAMSS